MARLRTAEHPSMYIPRLSLTSSTKSRCSRAPSSSLFVMLGHATEAGNTRPTFRKAGPFFASVKWTGGPLFTPVHIFHDKPRSQAVFCGGGKNGLGSYHRSCMRLCMVFKRFSRFHASIFSRYKCSVKKHSAEGVYVCQPLMFC